MSAGCVLPAPMYKKNKAIFDFTKFEKMVEAQGSEQQKYVEQLRAQVTTQEKALLDS